ncbi:TlpA family protein disulfide reductase [Alkaliphilus hydrothermalis]|uniref:Peroxiredoxin n=1 Tax=Alkaliphilus hydrothermalis TaxID=1482730 RepID=A0ABS2NP84_9FIRM|nr:TlpA disulfide reductase family protein [Alkaliphilus hydrothermalis]MBM7614741.1 peroxiredoxin [Alkaliphilus hydrothermalis]
MRSRYKLLAILLIIAMMAGVTAGCKKRASDDPQQPTAGGNPVVDQPQHQPKEQEQLPSGEKEDGDEGQEDNKVIITLENELREEVIIAAKEDKLLVMTFWVDWNQEAKGQLEVLENLYPLLKDDVEFVGIHALGFDSISKEQAQEKIKAEGYPYPMLIDEESKAQQKYFVGSFPTTVIIDQEGNVVKSLTSNIEEDDLLEEIEWILEKFLP